MGYHLEELEKYRKYKGSSSVDPPLKRPSLPSPAKSPQKGSLEEYHQTLAEYRGEEVAVDGEEEEADGEREGPSKRIKLSLDDSNKSIVSPLPPPTLNTSLTNPIDTEPTPSTPRTPP